ncbi:MAG: hypothetical protein GY824_00975, partial [Delftia sp.]|nr:hypothetical protein [Delftia sp.]
DQPVIETIFEYEQNQGRAVYADYAPACRGRLEQADPDFDFRRDVVQRDRE